MVWLCLALFAERLQGFPADNVTIVGTHTLRQAVNAEAFLKRAAKVIPYPIEIISGQEEARLIFMGVEHTQPEKGRKLVVDIGGGSTELVIGEDFEPLLAESRRMGCVSFAQMFSRVVKSAKPTSSVRAWPPRKSWKPWPGSIAFRAGSTHWAHRAPSRPRMKCW
ncbi:Exopolyphosphatase [Serratia odorifera]|uniref:Exopolyphosphatase n=1 Tax=Serratia odorifera TaxID=618 RepID=A0A447KTR6_SEROD|nr:Exopolyphosphatase [Serratia odorifera]